VSDQVAVIGSLVLIGACVAIVVFVTKTYRESMALAASAITSVPIA
jgi:preprotein translocase subunit SecF